MSGYSSRNTPPINVSSSFSPSLLSTSSSSSKHHEPDRRDNEERPGGSPYYDSRRRDDRRYGSERVSPSLVGNSSSKEDRGSSSLDTPRSTSSPGDGPLPECFRLDWIAEKESQIMKWNEMTRRIRKDDDALSKEVRKARFAYDMATKDVEKSESTLRFLEERLEHLRSSSYYF
jgi:hypothetical protein